MVIEAGLEVVAAGGGAAVDQVLDSHSAFLDSETGFSAPELGVAGDRVDEPADAFDLADHLVAHGDVRDAFGRSREYHVARAQRHEGAQVFDQERHVEDQVAGVALLREAAAVLVSGFTEPPPPPIPEPSTYALMLAGLAACTAIQRRRRSAPAIGAGIVGE